MVVFPSVNMTMTLALLELGSNRAVACSNASAWLVLPPADRASTAPFKSATEVISWVSCTAVSAKLTMPMRLPAPISPAGWPPVDSAMISIKVFAPAFILARGVPAILPERSSTRAISTGFDIISGAAVRASVTFSVSPHAICPVLSTLFEFVIPIRITSFWGRAPDQSIPDRRLSTQYAAAPAVLPEILSGLSLLRFPIPGEVEIFRSLL